MLTFHGRLDESAGHQCGLNDVNEKRMVDNPAHILCVSWFGLDPPFQIRKVLMPQCGTGIYRLGIYSIFRPISYKSEQLILFEWSTVLIQANRPPADLHQLTFSITFAQVNKAVIIIWQYCLTLLIIHATAALLHAAQPNRLLRCQVISHRACKCYLNYRAELAQR